MSHMIEVIEGERVVVIWLNRPDVHNALNEEMVLALTQALEAVSHRPTVAAVVLASKGDSFCSGTDLTWYQRGWDPSGQPCQAPTLVLSKLLQAIQDCPVPVIARVHGHCIGMGIGLVAAADIAFASHGAEFTQTETRLGFVPHLVAPYLGRAIGPRAAARWLMMGETFAASEAWRLGLIQEICEESEMDVRINAMLGNLLMAEPAALQQTRKIAKSMQNSVLNQAAEIAHGASLNSAASSPSREGVASFIEKRWPSWVPGDLKS